MAQKKKVMIGLIVGTAVMASVFAVAASITVTPETLGAGGDAVAACDDDQAVAATYTTAYSATAPAGYKVTEVKVTGLDEDCAGMEYKIQFTSSNPSVGTILEPQQSGTVGVHGGQSSNFANNTLTHLLSGPGTPLPASSITGVYVVFSG